MGRPATDCNIQLPGMWHWTMHLMSLSPSLITVMCLLDAFVLAISTCRFRTLSTDRSEECSQDITGSSERPFRTEGSDNYY